MCWQAVTLTAGQQKALSKAVRKEGDPGYEKKTNQQTKPAKL